MSHERTDNAASASDFSLHSPRMVEPLPELHTPHRRRKLILVIGIILVILDLCCLPITYYYALNFDTNHSLQDVFAVITGVYGFLSFIHYGFRSIKLFLNRYAYKYRPVNWTRWGMLEFLQVNVLIVISLVEIELVIGTAFSDPVVRLCAMPSPTICFYIGFLFCGSAMLTQLRTPLPFNMSSTEKGTPCRPALFAFVEDAGAIEAQGGVEFRKQIVKRYEMSPRFRRMMLVLTWVWGIGLLVVAIVSTVLIMVLTENVGLGIGWGLPWAWSAGLALATVLFVKKSIREEKTKWSAKETVGA